MKPDRMAKKVAKFDSKAVAARIAKELEPILSPEIQLSAYYNWIHLYPALDIYIQGELKVAIRPGMETTGQVMKEIIRVIGEEYKKDGIREQQAKLRALIGAPSVEDLEGYSKTDHDHNGIGEY